MKHLLLPLCVATLCLSGCNDDDNDVVTQPTPPEETPDTPTPGTPPKTGTGAFDNVWGPDVNFQLEGDIFVYLGKNNITRQDNADQFQFRRPENAIVINAADIRAAQPKSMRDDIFNDGQLTMGDLMLYVAKIKDNFEVRHEWNEDLSAYKYWVSYDANNDGDYEDVEEGDYKDDPNWYMNYIPNEGQFRRDTLYDERGETTYGRLELIHLQPRGGYYIHPMSKAMTDRREYFQKQEADRAREAKLLYPGENVAIFKEIQVTTELMEENPNPKVMVFKDVVARPHNLRPDIYKKDAVITVADALLTLHDEGKLDIKYSYWGKLATEVDVQHFFLNEINGVRAHGADGFLIAPKNKEGEHDFSAGKLSTMLQLYGTPYSSNPTSFCDENGDGVLDTSLDDHHLNPEMPEYDHYVEAAEKELALCNSYSKDELDITDWWTHWNQHLFTDVWVQNYPNDTITVLRFTMFEEFPANQSRRIGASNGDSFDNDNKWDIYDIKEAAHPLNADHFGWGIADCANCHSLEGIHSDGDLGISLGVNPKPVSVFDDVREYPLQAGESKAIAPYQCAQCHGSNGAPQGHGEIGRCFWCHTEEFVPQQHGAFSSYTTIGKLNVPGGNGDDPQHKRKASSYGEVMFNPAREIDWVDPSDAAAVEALNDKLKEHAKQMGWDKQSSPAYKPWLEDSPLMDISGAANHPAVPGIPGAADTEGRHWVGFYGAYPDEMKTRTNNDWSTDPTFPDPYSCMTCHPNN